MKPAQTKKDTKKRRGVKKGGVKQTLVKAKVTAVKTGRKLKGNKEEIEDLLETTANDSQLVVNVTTPGSAKRPKRKTTAAKKLGDKVRKSTSKLVEKPKRALSKKNLKEKNTNEVTTNGVHEKKDEQKTNGIAIEQASEAMETEEQNTGFLRKTMSKIWKIPNGITGIPYNDIQQQPPSPAKDTSNNTEQSKNSCVIC